MKEKKLPQLFVERETFEKNDKTYYSYYIKGVIRGREVKSGWRRRITTRIKAGIP